MNNVGTEPERNFTRCAPLREKHFCSKCLLHIVEYFLGIHSFLSNIFSQFCRISIFLGNLKQRLKFYKIKIELTSVAITLALIIIMFRLRVYGSPINLFPREA